MIPQFGNRKELFEWLRENKALLMHEKKSSIKHADSVYCVTSGPDVKSCDAAKELGIVDMPKPKNGIIYVKNVINTTNYLDSHEDVHIPGLWKKSIDETKLWYLLQEHQAKFDKVISDDVTAYTKSMSWKSLGYSFAGNTQAFVFDSAIKESRNPFMYEQYAQGFVKQHSVGMRYVKLFFAVNSDSKWDVEEKANWDKYLEHVANVDDVEERGYFFAVTEAKALEGSAVLFGSNPITPTLSVSEEAGKQATSLNIEPEKSTQPDYSFLKQYSIN